MCVGINAQTVYLGGGDDSIDTEMVSISARQLKSLQSIKVGCAIKQSINGKGVWRSIEVRWRADVNLP